MYYREIKSAVPVAEEDVLQLQETVKSILARVKSEGDEAVRYYEKEFDNYNPPSFRISEAQAAAAVEQLPARVVEELDYAIEQVTAFAQAQKDSLIWRSIRPPLSNWPAMPKPRALMKVWMPIAMRPRFAWTILLIKWRGPDPMQVVSGPIGREKSYFEAPPSDKVDLEVRKFISWWEKGSKREITDG